MRLLNTNTLQLETFYGVVPPYAILSHTWGPDEPTFGDMEAARASKRAGFNKILQSSSIAAKADLMYIWCDTICIDKSSSADLSEAINSMFRYYKQSAICYVYLEDVSLPSPTAQVDLSTFQASRWFTRGWTLQELIAPTSVSFFSSEWIYLGCKSSLSESIQMVTKIDDDILKDLKLLRNISIAKRMSWAASRETTREEDIAYCLLGIFDVNMPLLYGEGQKAFSRLQQEILKESSDQSLLAWSNLTACAPSFSSYVPPGSTSGGNTLTVCAPSLSLYVPPGSTTGAFADHPRRFWRAGDVTRFDPLGLFHGKDTASTITNRGLEINLPLLVEYDRFHTKKNKYTAILACYKAEGFAGPLGILLEPVRGSRGRVFRRPVSHFPLDSVSERDFQRAKMKRIHIQMNDQSVEQLTRYCLIRKCFREGFILRIDDVFILQDGPKQRWNAKTRTIPIPNIPAGSHGDRKIIAIIECLDQRDHKPEKFAVVISLDTIHCFSASVEIHEVPKDGSAYVAFLSDIRKCPFGLRRTAEAKCGQRQAFIARVGWEKNLSREELTLDIKIVNKSFLPNWKQIRYIVLALYLTAVSVWTGISSASIRKLKVSSLQALVECSIFIHFVIFMKPLCEYKFKSWRYWASITATYLFLAFLYVKFPGAGKVLILSTLNGACLFHHFTKEIPSSEGEFQRDPLRLLLHWLRHIESLEAFFVVLMFAISATKTTSYFSYCVSTFSSLRGGER